MWLRQEAEVRATGGAADVRKWVRDKELRTQDGLTGGTVGSTG